MSDLPSPILRAEKLTKSFYQNGDSPLFHDVSLTLYPGDTVAITGPSGVGKTTLLHILGTLDPPSLGSLEIVGQDGIRGNKAAIRHRHIGFVFQNFNLLLDLTAVENVCIPGRIGKRTKSSKERIKKALKLLDQVSLSHKAYDLARTLSGGEKQRIAIARALYNEPELILADEPSGNLDEMHSQDIHHLLLSLAQTQGKGIILVTHNPHLSSLCQKSFYLSQTLHEQLS